MSVSSGVIPYQYQGAFPWKVTDPDEWPLGFSGIPFEECMFVSLAELRRYQQPNGTNELKFQNYQYKDFTYPGTSNARTEFGFEPAADGRNLNNSGQIHATDWINDLRVSLSGLSDFGVFGLANLDTDAASQDPQTYGRIWLRAKVGSTPGTRGPIGDRYWNHEFYNADGVPPAPLLGYKGTLFDIDLNEVQYQPFPRLRKATSMRIADGLDFNNIVITPASPVFPGFATLTGDLVDTTTQDDKINFNSDFSYLHVGSGLVRIDGDVLLDTGSYEIVPNAFMTPAVHGFRSLGGHITAQVPITRIFCSPSASSRGIHTFRVFNNNIYPPSGEQISQYPNDYLDSILLPGSGFEYLTDALWLPTYPIVRSSNTVVFFGMYLVSPYSNNRLWTRFAASGAPAVDLNPSLTLEFCGRDVHGARFGFSPPENLIACDSPAGTTFIFKTYNNLLEKQATYNADTWLGTTNSQFDRLWFDPGFLYQSSDRSNSAPFKSMIARFTLGAITDQTQSDVFLYDSTLNTDPVSNPAQSFIPGFYFGGFHYAGIAAETGGFVTVGVNQVSGIAAIDYVTDPSHIGTYAFGTFKVINGVNFGLPIPLRIISLEVIEGATDLNDGVWALLSVGAPDLLTSTYFFARIEEDVSSWNIVELYGDQPHDLYNGTMNYSNTTDFPFFFRMPLRG